MLLLRPQTLWLPDGSLTTTVYDAVGNPIASISPLGYITTQAFDSRKRLIGRQDLLGRWTLTLTYDNAGRVWMQQDGKGQITTHSYVNCGDESARLYADGSRLTFSYNVLRQLTLKRERRNPAGSVLPIGRRGAKVSRNRVQLRIAEAGRPDKQAYDCCACL